MTSATAAHRTLLSADGTYRYGLAHEWGSLPYITDLWILLNPSAADTEDDDPTIRRCIDFSQSWGASGLFVANLYGLRATNLADLAKHHDPVGPRNDDYIRGAALLSRYNGGRIIAAWGGRALARRRAEHVLGLLGDNVLSLGTTRAGHPRHPLDVKSDTQPQPYPRQELT